MARFRYPEFPDLGGGKRVIELNFTREQEIVQDLYHRSNTSAGTTASHMYDAFGLLIRMTGYGYPRLALETVKRWVESRRNPRAERFPYNRGTIARCPWGAAVLESDLASYIGAPYPRLWGEKKGRQDFSIYIAPGADVGDLIEFPQPLSPSRDPDHSSTARVQTRLTAQGLSVEDQKDQGSLTASAQCVKLSSRIDEQEWTQFGKHLDIGTEGQSNGVLGGASGFSPQSPLTDEMPSTYVLPRVTIRNSVRAVTQMLSEFTPTYVRDTTSDSRAKDITIPSHSTQVMSMYDGKRGQTNGSHEQNFRESHDSEVIRIVDASSSECSSTTSEMVLSSKLPKRLQEPSKNPSRHQSSTNSATSKNGEVCTITTAQVETRNQKATKFSLVRDEDMRYMSFER
ncbi:hypothetical protein MMC25_005975 [Agyrium rufum]|nr:hypothetical protein [Agyrium rufum]